MPFVKPNYLLITFHLLILNVFLIGNSFGQINHANFSFDSLKANWTSGNAPAQIKGSIYLKFKVPAGMEATLLMQTNPKGNYTAQAVFGDKLSTQTQKFTSTIPNLNVRDDIYCFKLELKNGNNTVSSKQLCSIPYQKGVLDNKISIYMASYQPGTDSLFRPLITGKCISDYGCSDDSTRFGTGTKFEAPYRETTGFESVVKCGERKIYQVMINVDGMISLSDTILNVGDTDEIPSKLIESLAYATVEDDKVKLFWRNDETENDSLTLEYKFILERKDGANGSFKTLPQAKELIREPGSLKTAWEYVDNTSEASKLQYYYRLKYEDYCSNQSPPIDITPIFLEQDNAEHNFELFWNIENNNKLVDYEVEYYDSPEVESRKTFLITPKANRYKAETSNYYRVGGKQYKNGTYIYSNFIPNNENIKVLAPTVFTPDGKGPIESETFSVTVAATYTFFIAIYDRAGLLVYFSDNYRFHKRDGWNGKLIYTDIDLPEGVYAYQVEVTNSNHRAFTKRGSVVLVRD